MRPTVPSPVPQSSPPARQWAWHGWSPWVCAIAALSVSLFFFSPRWWVFTHPMPGSTYWSRGLEFMAQCGDPFRNAAIEPGLAWRLAPALFAHALGLHGYAALAVPWLGLMVLLATTAAITYRLTTDVRLAWWTTVLMATTSATLTVTGWLGMNDAWYATALLLVAFGRGRLLPIAALAIGPWIDERFLLGLPFACCLRARQSPPAQHTPVWIASVVSAAAYLGIRFSGVVPLAATAAANDFLRGTWRQAYHWLPWTPLGWFMGWRAAWGLAAGLGLFAWRDGKLRELLLPFGTAAASLLILTPFSSDTSRAPTMLTPLLVAGVLRFATELGPVGAARALAAITVVNLLLPAMHVVVATGDIINMLPLELARLVLQPSAT